MISFKHTLLINTLKIFILGLILNFITVFYNLTISFAAELSPETDLNNYVNQMRIEQKVGQLFVVGFSEPTLTPEIKSFLKNNYIGSVVLFKRNIRTLYETQKLTTDLNKLVLSSTGTPPFLAIDQEGGFVSRIPFYPQIPSAYSIGLSSNPLISESIGYEVGRGIHSLGFNLNFAPVLDVIDINSNSFVSHRSFGSKPELVGEMGVSFSNGLLRSGVIPTAKHFPGIGSITSDPHKQHISLDIMLPELEHRHLLPFQEFSKIGSYSAIMISHLSYPKLDPTGTPAVFSKIILTDLLRKKLNYSGLIITDDLQMSGATDYASTDKAAVLSLTAGTDLVMLTWSMKDQQKSIQKVVEHYSTNKQDLPDLNDKVKRILLVKKFLLKNQSQQHLALTERSKFLSSKSLRKSIDDVLETNLERYRQPLKEITLESDALISNANRAPSSVTSSSRMVRSSTLLPNTCVFSNSTQFNSSFGSVIRTAKYFSLDTLQKINTNKLEKNCQLSLAILQTKSSLNQISLANKDVKSRLILVNLSALAIAEPKDTDDFKFILKLNFSYLNAGKKIAELIRSFNVSSLVNPNPLLLDQFHVLNQSTQYPLRSHLQVSFQDL